MRIQFQFDSNLKDNQHNLNTFYFIYLKKYFVIQFMQNGGTDRAILLWELSPLCMHDLQH